jgi:hypothetical protein
MRRIKQRCHLGIMVLALAAAVFVQLQPAARRIARFAQIGGQRREVLEGDVGADAHRIRQQQFAQQRDFHRLALKASAMASPI